MLSLLQGLSTIFETMRSLPWSSINLIWWQGWKLILLSLFVEWSPTADLAVEGRSMDFPHRNVVSPCNIVATCYPLKCNLNEQWICNVLLTTMAIYRLVPCSKKDPCDFNLVIIPVIHIDGRIFTSGARTDPSPPDWLLLVLRLKQFVLGPKRRC